MKIAILLGSPDISGGTNVIFEHAIRMKNRGWEITIITEEKVEASRLNWHKQSKNLRWKTYTQIKKEKFDIVLATWWRTVYNLKMVQAKKYTYFVQSIESFFYNDRETAIKKLADDTYRLPLKIITEATWIQKYLFDNFNQKAQLVRNGINKDFFQLDGPVISPREKNKLRILIEGPLGVTFKNVEKTIKLCSQSNADEIWLLTLSPVKSYPGVDRVFSGVPIDKVAEIYRSCDVIVKLSYIEGMFGPPLEMFHCGGTAIVYKATGHDEYIKNNYNALTVEIDNEKEVIKKINQLKENETLLNKLKKNAIETARQWHDWQESSKQFALALEKIIKEDQADKKLIFSMSDDYFSWYDLTMRDKKKGLVDYYLGLQKYPWLWKIVSPTWKAVKAVKNKIIN